MSERFEAPWWLPTGHLQTLWPTLARKRPPACFDSERLELPDGDFLDLHWLGPDSQNLAVILHGLAGSSQSTYASGISLALAKSGWRVCVMHFRGCSGEFNRLDRSYHSGDTGDVDFVVRTLNERLNPQRLVTIGYSLGGNMMLKWLGELGESAPVERAVAVSVPFQLDRAADALNQGFSRLYQWWLIRSLVTSFKKKFASRELPAQVHADVSSFSSFWWFDDRVTAPLHGFEDVWDYYTKSSSRQYLKDIRVPTILLQAEDDPFLPREGIPTAVDLNEFVTLNLQPKGGHVGFVYGSSPWTARYWLEECIPTILG